VGRGVPLLAVPGREEPAASSFCFTHGWHWQTDTIARVGASEPRLSAPAPLPFSVEGRAGWRDKSLDTEEVWRAAPHPAPACSRGCQRTVPATIPVRMGKQPALGTREPGDERAAGGQRPAVVKR